MAHTKKKTKVVGNPAHRAFSRSPKKYQRSSSHRKRTRPNPGDAILGFTLAGNPGRKARNTMAKTKSKKRPGGYGKHAKHYKHNPVRHGQKMRKYRRSHNPTGVGGFGPMITNAAFVIIGALGSKLGAQAVLGSNNVGLLGYAGNAAVGGVLWFITEKVMKNRAASTGIISGTIVQILLRVINDYTPFGSYVAQLGMGDYQAQSFVTPQILVDPWNSAEIAIPDGWGARAPAALPAAPSTVPAGTPMPRINGGAGGSGSSPGTGVSGLYGAGGGWGGGLYSA